MKQKVMIEIINGAVRSIITNSEIEVTVIDWDNIMLDEKQADIKPSTDVTKVTSKAFIEYLNDFKKTCARYNSKKQPQ